MFADKDTVGRYMLKMTQPLIYAHALRQGAIRWLHALGVCAVFEPSWLLVFTLRLSPSDALNMTEASGSTKSWLVLRLAKENVSVRRQ